MAPLLRRRITALAVRLVVALRTEAGGYAIAALLPGILFSIAIGGPGGVDLPALRGLGFPEYSDLGMSLAALSHAASAPWTDLFTPATFEGGISITAADGYPLLAPIAKLLGSADAALNLLLITLPLLAAGGTAAAARAMGARGLLPGLTAGVIGAVWPPFLFNLFGSDMHPHLGASGLLGFALALGIALPRSQRPGRLVAIGALLSVTAFLLIPYLAFLCLAPIVGGAVDALRAPAHRRAILTAGLGSILFGLTVMGVTGWFDGSFSVSADSYGKVTANLLGIFWPIGCPKCSILPTISPAPFGQDPSSYAFIGLGALLLLPAALVVLWRSRRGLWVHLGFVIAVASAAIYAFGPTLSLGSLVLFDVPAPLAALERLIGSVVRNGWLFLYPLSLLAAAGGVAAVSRIAAARPPVAALLALVAIGAQIAPSAPVLAYAADYQRPAETPHDRLFQEVVAHSPDGLRIHYSLYCTTYVSADPYFVGFEIAHAATAAAGRAGAQIYGVRWIREPIAGRAPCALTPEQVWEEHARGRTLLLGGVSDVGDLPPRPIGIDGCLAAPLTTICVGDRSDLRADPAIAAGTLPIDRQSGLPLLPAAGLDTPDPRLAAALSLSGIGWVLDPYDPEGHIRTRPGDIALRLAWPVSAGASLRLFVMPLEAPASLRLAGAETRVTAPMTISIAGSCAADRCHLDLAGEVDGILQLGGLHPTHTPD